MVANRDRFDETLPFGQMGESLIAKYLRRHGYSIFPAYEKEIDNGKGPRIFLPYGYSVQELITPDMLAKRERRTLWIEAKHKSAATFYRKKQRWQTGIDKRHYLDYLQVEKVTGWPVRLLFLQRLSVITNAPLDVEPCPTGLYACSITCPVSDEGYYHERMTGRRYDMVYWAIDTLKKLATLEDVLSERSHVDE